MSVIQPLARQVTVQFPVAQNEQGESTLWLASWLWGNSGEEGGWFYSGRGGEEVAVAPPSGAGGIRIRRWVSDGLPPEYADWALATGLLLAGALDFDRPQPHARFSLATPAG